MAETPVRFGILGCASIARKLSRAIKLAPNAAICAVGSRSLEKAQKFAAENGFPESAKVYGSYEAVLNDPDVDAVYVPLPTGLHVRFAVLAAEKGKHVLLEKPVALNVAELDAILAACEANGVQFMDGTMWMHHPRTAQMSQFLSDSQRFGKLKLVSSSFAHDLGEDLLKNDIRGNPELDGLGALGDVGWYCIRAILWAADYQLPRTATVLGKPELNDAGVILSCAASLSWEDGRLATFYCSLLVNVSSDVTVIGNKGNLRFHDYVIPFSEKVGTFYTVSNSRFTELQSGVEPAPTEHAVATELPQEALMVKEFASLVSGIKRKGSKPEKKWPSISRKTQLVLDAVKASIDGGSKTVEILN